MPVNEPGDAADPRQESIERDRLKLDRQRLALDTMMRRMEARKAHRGPFAELLANPITLAIVGGGLVADHRRGRGRG